MAPVVILGGGLAGMSTAFHLGDRPHVVLEAEDLPGGLCTSRTLDGFVFDATGHLLHLRDPRIVALVEALLPGRLVTTRRDARVRMMGVALPFPFQANLHGLPVDLVARCIETFVESLQRPVPDHPATSFEDWSVAVLGQGISDAFMFPYNRKLFRREPSEMTADWVSWAVPRPNLRQVIDGALGVVHRDLGYNPTFRYPDAGGIGVLPAALAERVPSLRLGARVVAVDLDRRDVTLAGGERLSWSALVVTIPLSRFLGMCRGGGVDWAGLGARLDWTVVGCVNLGVARPGLGDGAHWLYCPDPEVPFYRVGFPSNLSAGVAPPGTSSMYVEFGLRRDEPFHAPALEQAAIDGLVRLGILAPDDRILVKDTLRIDPGYVIFDRERQAVMAEVGPALDRHAVHPIGRYGAWTYSYMERALLDGLELAGRLQSESSRTSLIGGPPRGTR